MLNMKTNIEDEQSPQWEKIAKEGLGDRGCEYEAGDKVRRVGGRLNEGQKERGYEKRENGKKNPGNTRVETIPALKKTS